MEEGREKERDREAEGGRKREKKMGLVGQNRRGWVVNVIVLEEHNQNQGV